MPTTKELFLIYWASELNVLSGRPLLRLGTSRQRFGVRLSSAALVGENRAVFANHPKKPKRRRTAALQNAGSLSDAPSGFGTLLTPTR